MDKIVIRVNAHMWHLGGILFVWMPYPLASFPRFGVLVMGTGMFSEVSSSLADFLGVRSSAFEQKLQAAKRHAMDALKYIAAERGANAVLAIDLDYTEFSGNRIALIINGTLVRIEPRE